MTALDEKLTEVARQYDDLGAELARPEVATDPGELRRLGRELARLEPVVDAFRRLETTRTELAGARELRDAGDAGEELRSMAQDEVVRLEADEARLLDDLKVLLLPRDPNDDRDVILEIRAGAGGEEAALFARRALPDVRAIQRAAPLHARAPESQRDRHRRHQGGDRPGPWRRRLQSAQVRRGRPPRPAHPRHGIVGTDPHVDGDGDRPPEADEVEINIDEERDLRIDVKRSSGPGGQSVNTTDSAVRITHLPTGLVVEIQDEKSQHKNKAKAMSVLRSRLYDLELQKQREADSVTRRSMIGAGDRSDKVRTYNFPQDRVTDHRIGKSLHNLPAVMDGELDDLIDALQMADQADRLGSLTESGAA